MRPSPFPWFSKSAALVCLAALASGCRPDGAHTPVTGQVLFASCNSCHGANGEGNHQFAAPAIAGLPRWYVESQLNKFRTGLRGGHPDDVEGLRMRPMSRQLMSDAEIATVSKYTSELKPPAAQKTLEGGNPEAGKVLFATCQACHGPNGLGNEALKAPPIAGQHDWYLYTSLKKFKAGVRGTATGDTWGATMRPMAMTLPDEQAIKNVIAYVGTLKQ